MREFYLINGNGHQYSLMDVEHWLYQPSNLGAKFNSKYAQIDAQFIRTKKIPKPDDIRGTILFTGTKQYDNYFEFIKFVAVEPLTLMYITNRTYYASVDIKQIDKKEIEGGILKADIRLKRLSRWYQDIFVKNMDVEGIGKTYAHGYPMQYGEYDAQTVVINSDSTYDSPTKIVIYGPCTNPKWQQYLNGKIQATGSCQCQIRAGRKLVIDCTKTPYTIREEDNKGNVTADLYGTSDFETERFINLGMGNNRIVIDHDGTNTLGMLVEARVEYETV